MEIVLGLQVDLAEIVKVLDAALDMGQGTDGVGETTSISAHFLGHTHPQPVDGTSGVVGEGDLDVEREGVGAGGVLLGDGQTSGIGVGGDDATITLGELVAEDRRELSRTPCSHKPFFTEDR